MKVLKPTLNTQTISIIPRIYSNYVILSIHDESTNEVIDYNLVTSLNNDYLEINNTYNLVEGRWYNITLKDVGSGFIERVNEDLGVFEISSCFYDFYNVYGGIIYKDRIFCTNQEVNQPSNDYYTINKNKYIQEVSNNDFIIIE